MSCAAAFLATALMFAPAPAVANGDAPPVLLKASGTAAAAPASVAQEPMFADIVARARRLKAESERLRATPGLDAAAAPLTLSGLETFQAEIADLAALDMQGHLELAKRGTDGDLKCILKGIAQDLPVRMREFAAARTGAQQKSALAEMSYLLNDNVEVITAPPAPPA